jgi:hypothetical protein
MKKVIIGLLTITFLCLGTEVFLAIHYMKTMPDKPQPELSRIHPFNVHGSVVYLTREQELLLKWLFGIMVASGLSAGILNVAFKKI